jgi:uroporphyrinogen-III synthase
MIAAVGPATAAELESFGIQPSLIADPPEGEVLARLIAGVVRPAGRIAIVRGNLRAGGMDEALKAAGYELLPLEVYENVSPAIPSLDPVPVAAVFVASPSAGDRILQRNGWLRACRFVCIGETTERALRSMGVTSVVATGASLNDWVDELCEAHAQAIGWTR